MNKQELNVPPILISLFEEKRWPKIVTTRKFRARSPYITDERFELFQSADEVLGNNNIATLDLFLIWSKIVVKQRNGSSHAITRRQGQLIQPGSILTGHLCLGVVHTLVMTSG